MEQNSKMIISSEGVQISIDTTKQTPKIVIEDTQNDEKIKTGAVDRNTNNDGRLNPMSNRKCRFWFITYWCDSQNDAEQKIEAIKKFVENYNGQIFGQIELTEKQKENEGKLHIQCCIETKNTIRGSTIMENFPGIHIEPTRKIVAARKYCQKTDTKVGNSEFSITKKPLKDKIGQGEVQLKNWQKEILDLIETEPDDRSIYWYWEPKGNVGKTTLARHICIKHKGKALYLNGGVKDIEYAVAQYVMANGETSLIVCLFDIPRTRDGYVSYEALEKIKDGIFFSGKYESGQIVINPPHIICMANFEPDYEKLSSDRWVIRNIEELEKPQKQIHEIHGIKIPIISNGNVAITEFIQDDYEKSLEDNIAEEIKKAKEELLENF